ncbi:MAG TPA: MFS transporter [Jatrophihabitans sp.]|uniref:MFS transporter n=1 Tax=Jatrophihabitans sp. TaxID=1932789 RepID=UPI002E00129B|nr:MFS transporter [Jatrophihabitans sp.]
MTATVDRTAPPDLAASEASAVVRRRWTGFAVVITAMILNILDSTILNVAAPSIQRDLGASASAIEWIAASYTLAIAVGLLTGGRLGDRYGRRTMLLLGLTGFLVASVACASAWSPGSLIAARVVQGLSAALLTPQTFGLIRDLFPPDQIGKAFAAFGPIIGLSTVAGPIVAGSLIQLDPFGADWRSLFLINVPFGLFALAVGHRVLPAGVSKPSIRLDLVGTGLIGAASFLLVFPLVDGRSLGWPVWLFAAMAAAVPLLAVFVAQQRRRTRRGTTPLVEFSVLAKRSYVSGVAFTLSFFGAITGFSLTLGLFLQVGLGFTAMHAALYLVAMSVGAVVGSGVGAWAATAVGRPILHVGLSIMAVGVEVLLVSLAHSGAMPGAGALLPGLAVVGTGMGMIFVPLFSIITGEIEDHEVGSASAVLESLQQLGSSLGVAVLATLFFSRLALEHGGPRAALAAGRHLGAVEATLWATLVMLGISFALGWLLPRRARTGA